MNRQIDDNSEQNAMDFALPFDKDKDGEAKGNHASAFDDMEDYVFLTPAKKRKNSHGRHSRKKNKRLRGWRKALVIILTVLVVLMAGGVTSFVVLTNIGRGQMLDDNVNASINVPDNIDSDQNGKYIYYKGKKYQINENITSILFMGIDKESLNENDAEYGTNGDADVLALMTFDTLNGKTNLISVSRDIMTDIDVYSLEGNYVGTENKQICLAYAYGNGRETSCEKQVSAVRRLFYNVPISSYFAIDLSSIGTLNDVVGGVTVTSPETIGEFKEGEEVTLYGDMAESFVRSRNIKQLDSNNSRMERQRMYIKGFFNKVVSQTKKNIMTPIDLYNAASPYMVTNIDASKVTYMAGNILQKNFSDLNMQTVPGQLKQGETYAEYYVDEEKFFEMFLNIYYNPVD